MKYRIEHSNTAVRKLHNLAKNGVIARSTVANIFKNEEDGYIVFNSKRTYDMYKKYKSTTLAMFDHNGN